MSEQQRKNSLLRSSISINSIRRTASQFTKSLERSNIIAKDIIKTTKDRNLFERNTTAKDKGEGRKVNNQKITFTKSGWHCEKGS